MAEKKGVYLEYSAIREEIVNLTNSKDQMILAMYSICVAILGLAAFWNVQKIVGLMFIVLIPFQALINTKLYQIARCGAYINIFIEPKIKGLKWEEIIHDADKEFNYQYRFNLGNIQFTRNIAKYGASIFAILAIVAYIYNCIEIVECMIQMSFLQYCEMIVYILLGIFVLYLNKKGTDFEKIYNTYINIFKNRAEKQDKI